MPPNSDSNTAGMLYISGVVAHTLYVGRFTPVEFTCLLPGLISQTDLTALTGRVPPKQGTRFVLSSGLGLIPRVRSCRVGLRFLRVTAAWHSSQASRTKQSSNGQRTLSGKVETDS